MKINNFNEFCEHLGLPAVSVEAATGAVKKQAEIAHKVLLTPSIDQLRIQIISPAHTYSDNLRYPFEDEEFWKTIDEGLEDILDFEESGDDDDDDDWLDEYDEYEEL